MFKDIFSFVDICILSFSLSLFSVIITTCEEDAATAVILMVCSDIPRDYFPTLHQHLIMVSSDIPIKIIFSIEGQNETKSKKVATNRNKQKDFPCLRISSFVSLIIGDEN